MMNRINIFIPSAGLGERLRLFTEHIPKPLIPILGRPILDIVLEKVSALPINRIGINLHHKSEEIKKWIDRLSFKEKVDIFYEKSLLGTGGALKNAEGLLRDSIFLVYNSDILSDIDIGSLIDFHLSSGNISTLAVHDYMEFNNVAIDNKGLLKGIGKEYPDAESFVAFTGIAVYSPEFLRSLPEGFSSVVDGWLKAVDAGYRVGTVDVSGTYWRDIGRPDTYVDAVLYRLREDGEMVFIHPSARVSEDLKIDGYVVIEGGCKVNKGVSFKNAVLLPGAEIEEGSYYEDSLIGLGYRIDVFRSADKVLIGTGGSDRSYYRIKRDNAVMMESRGGDPDFERHIEYTRFFQKHSFPVPRLIEVDHSGRKAVFEDLGDISLYSYLRLPRREEEIERIYRKVLDILVSLHTEVTSHVSECITLKDRPFDYEHLRWETDYFMERFVKGVRGIEIHNKQLEDEFHRIALKVDSFPKTVIHRDFQSQNIMIQKDGIPRVVDYQGARIGPPAYDLVSILWDPYYRLKDKLREGLIDYYIKRIKFNETLLLHSKKKDNEDNPPQPPFSKGGLGGFVEEKAFMESLLPCRLQRHMQALGAYGFLSMIKGKKYFLKHVPEGLRLLKEDVSLAKEEYPELYKLVINL